LDKRIMRARHAQGAFRGTIINAENVGKTADDLVAQWYEAHPDDPVE
jgi:hypothetical protein